MNIDDLFNMDNDLSSSITEQPKGSRDENLYTINLEDAVDGVYKAKVRFLPNPRNAHDCMVSKYTYYLTDVNGENGMVVDDPSSVGEKSPIGITYFKLKNSSNPVDQNLAKEMFNRQDNNFAFVQIVQDQQHPELEGKVLIFKFGAKIKGKLKAEGEDQDDGCNPFNLFAAREFKIEVKKVGGYNNYDSCKFVGAIKPIKIDGKELKKDATGKKLLEKLFADIPSLEDYKYKPWSAEMLEQVNERLATFIGGSKTTNLVEKVMSGDEPEEEATDYTSGASLLDGIDL